MVRQGLSVAFRGAEAVSLRGGRVGGGWATRKAAPQREQRLARSEELTGAASWPPVSSGPVDTWAAAPQPDRAMTSPVFAFENPIECSGLLLSESPEGQGCSLRDAVGGDDFKEGPLRFSFLFFGS